MRKLVALSLLLGALGLPKPSQASQPTVIHLPYLGVGSARIALAFAPSEVVVPPPGEVEVVAAINGDQVDVTARDLVGLSEMREEYVTVVLARDAWMAERIPILLIPAGSEAVTLGVPFGGGASTQVSVPFPVRHVLAPAPDGLVVKAQASGARVNVSVYDKMGGLASPHALNVVALGDNGARAHIPILLLPYWVTGDEWEEIGKDEQVAPFGALSSGFTPAARAMTLNLGASGTTTFTLALPPGPFTLLRPSSANYDVVLTPTSGTSTGAPFVVTATVTALGRTSSQSAR
jgi:hypothetical protein